MLHVSISNGNSKMGKIKSVSLPSLVTCRHNCPCREKCYAHKIEKIRPNVLSAYQRNLWILQNHPDQYWREVEAAIMMSRFFRFHVSGDIPSSSYLERMVDVASRQRFCHILCFTKRFEMVNNYIASHGPLPNNLHIILSGWRGFVFQNPYNLPEAHVRFKDGVTTARPDAISCNGNCSECAVTDSGCWTLTAGEQVVFDEH